MRWSLLVCAALIVLSCEGDTAPLVASEVRVSKPLPGTHMAAGYFTLTNNSEQPIRITRVTSPQFGKVEMHETVVEDGIARMVGLGDLTIAANSSVTFAPGSKHLMLMQPAADLHSVTLDFHTADATVLTVSVVVGD